MRRAKGRGFVLKLDFKNAHDNLSSGFSIKLVLANDLVIYEVH